MMPLPSSAPSSKTSSSSSPQIHSLDVPAANKQNSSFNSSFCAVSGALLFPYWERKPQSLCDFESGYSAGSLEIALGARVCVCLMMKDVRKKP
jgi:hypothetical protein